MENVDIGMEELVGKRMRLSGVSWRKGVQTEPWQTEPQEFLFVLDGKTYVAQEDACDDYRSALHKLYITEDKPDNMFPPIMVVVRMSAVAHAEILELVDVVTGKVVLEFGTDDYDDYYPCYVANFMPEAMATNQ